MKSGESKPVFSSLGVQYTSQFTELAWELLRYPRRHNKRDSFLSCKKKIEQEFGGSCHFFLKGRDALEAALRQAGITSGKVVFTQAFSCIALEQAIIRAGATVQYVDTGVGQVNMSVESLAQMYSTHKAAVVIVQHSLGIPADIVAIKEWCLEHDVLLIEDLAQAYGGSSQYGMTLGSHADIVVLSFGRDKIVDALLGGAVIFKDHIAAQLHLQSTPLTQLQKKKKLLYPMLTQYIRAFSPSFLAKTLFHVGKILGVLDSPVNADLAQIGSYPQEFAVLLEYQLRRLEADLAHRRMIAAHYFSLFAKEYAEILLCTQEQLLAGSCLRFPILVHDPDGVTRALATKQIFMRDRWYRQAVDCGSSKCSSEYQKGSCKNAEYLAEYIINLPTHREITLEIASDIVEEIKSIVRV